MLNIHEFKQIVLVPVIVIGEKQKSLMYWSFDLLRDVYKDEIICTIKGLITLHLIKGSLTN